MGLHPYFNITILECSFFYKIFHIKCKITNMLKMMLKPYWEWKFEGLKNVYAY